MVSRKNECGPLEQVFACATARIIDSYSVTEPMSVEKAAAKSGLSVRRTHSVVKHLVREGVLLVHTIDSNKTYVMNRTPGSYTFHLVAYCDGGRWRKSV